MPNRLRYICVLSIWPWSLLILNQAHASNVVRTAKICFFWKSVEASHWHVSIRFWVVGQRMKVFYRSLLFVSCHYFVLAESFYPFLPSHIVYGNEYVVSAHHSNSIKNIEYYTYFVTFHYHLSLTSKNTQHWWGCKNSVIDSSSNNTVERWSIYCSFSPRTLLRVSRKRVAGPDERS